MSISIEILFSMAALAVAVITLLLRMRKDRLDIEIKMTTLENAIASNKVNFDLQFKQLDEKVGSHDKVRVESSKVCQVQNALNIVNTDKKIDANAQMVERYMEQNRYDHALVFEKLDSTKDIIIEFMKNNK